MANQANERSKSKSGKTSAASALSNDGKTSESATVLTHWPASGIPKDATEGFRAKLWHIENSVSMARASLHAMDEFMSRLIQHSDASEWEKSMAGAYSILAMKANSELEEHFKALWEDAAALLRAAERK